jgi:hypothetical protein
VGAAPANRTVATITLAALKVTGPLLRVEVVGIATGVLPWEPRLMVPIPIRPQRLPRASAGRGVHQTGLTELQFIQQALHRRSLQQGERADPGQVGYHQLRQAPLQGPVLRVAPR